MKMNPESDWWFAEARKDGVKHYVRARRVADVATLAVELPILMVITWQYAGNAEGMPPNESTIEKMDRFENLLVGGVEEVGIAVKTSCVTGAGQRIWNYYAHNADSFREAMRLALANQPPFPIEVEAVDDPGWLSIKKLNANLRKGGH